MRHKQPTGISLGTSTRVTTGDIQYGSEELFIRLFEEVEKIIKVDNAVPIMGKLDVYYRSEKVAVYIHESRIPHKDNVECGYVTISYLGSVVYLGILDILYASIRVFKTSSGIQNKGKIHEILKMIEYVLRNTTSGEVYSVPNLSNYYKMLIYSSSPMTEINLSDIEELLLNQFSSGYNISFVLLDGTGFMQFINMIICKLYECCN